MAAPRKFLVREHENKDGSITFYARFTDQHGTRQEYALGRTPNWTRQRAETEMRHIKADVERGFWSRDAPSPGDAKGLLFSTMAKEWWKAKVAGQMATRTQMAYSFELEGQLVPFFGAKPVSTITKKEVDAFVRNQVAEGLAPHYINKQLQRLGQVLDLAMDWYDDILPANPARGKARRVADKKTHSSERWLDADQIELLLHAARELDQSSRRADYGRLGRESLIGCLCFSGLRNTELCELTWSDIDFVRRTIQPSGTKTEAALRYINIVDGLLPLLEAHRAQTLFGGKSDPVWATARGTHRDKDSLNHRILRPVVAKARELVADDEQKASTGAARAIEVALPDRITPHTFRRTFCAFATEATRDPNYVMGQMGHKDAGFTQRVYNRITERTGDPDPRVMAWMERPRRAAPDSRFHLSRP